MAMMYGFVFMAMYVWLSIGRAPTQAQQITANSVEVITIDENIEEARNIQEMKESTVEEHVAKKLKYMEH